MSEPTSKDFEDNQLTEIEARAINMLIARNLELLEAEGNYNLDGWLAIKDKLDWQADNANRFEPIKTIGSNEPHYKRKW